MHKMSPGFQQTMFNKYNDKIKEKGIVCKHAKCNQQEK